jgi:hypothetical protein
MAISTDSFGSPGLGEGIGLQGTLKDYTPLIAKNRMAQQAMAGKAAQKKLDTELAEQEKQNQDLSKFKVFGAGIPAFTPAYQKISDDFVKTLTELKSKPGPPVTSRMEYLQAKAKAQQEFDKLRFQEDSLMPALKATQNINPQKQIVDNELLTALWDDTGEGLRKLNNGKIGIPANRALIKDVPQYNFDLDWKNAVKKVVPQEGKGYQEAMTPQGVPIFQYDETSVYTQGDIDRTWNEFKLQPSFKNRVKNNAIESNTSEEQIEQELYNQFNALFKNKRKQTASQIREDKSSKFGPGGAQPAKDINISYTDNAGDQTSYLRPYAERAVEKRLKDEFDKYKNGETLDFFESIGLSKDDESRKATTYDKFKLKIEKYNSTQSDESNKIADVDKMIKLLTQQSVFSKYKNRPGINVVRTNAPQNKDFKGVKDIKGNVIDAAFMSYIPADKAKGLPSVFLVLRDNGGGEYSITEVPANDHNKSVYAPEFSIDPKVESNNFDYWFNKKKSDAASGVGGESVNEAYGDGGKVEPKSVSQKYHNKSKNLTKFVYSDGSEEVFNGIL